MEIKPEIVELVRFTSSSKALWVIDNIWMVELQLDLEDDIDGEGCRRAQQRFFNWDGAMDEFARLETEEMIFWEFGIDSPPYQDYVARYYANPSQLGGVAVVKTYD
jgi:hypothetical protein